MKKANPLSLIKCIYFVKRSTLKAKKSLAQNFLFDKNIINKILNTVRITDKNN